MAEYKFGEEEDHVIGKVNGDDDRPANNNNKILGVKNHLMRKHLVLRIVAQNIQRWTFRSEVLIQKIADKVC